MLSSKITMIIHAGLGNQLFMIFTALSKSIDENKDFSIYPIFNNGFRGYYFTTLFKKLLFKVENKIEDIQQRNGYEEQVYHYNPIPKDAVVLKGYFQSPKYFDHNKNKIIEMLELDKYQNRYKFDFDAIMVHFRFGDFTINQINHVQLTPLYYINAIKHLLNIVPDAKDKYKFIIFAEDGEEDLVDDYIEEIKKEIEINFIKIYEIYPKSKDYQDLMYMNSCKHFIIANSSFSWFGAYLSPNKDKKVLYPNVWFGPSLKDQKNTKDLFPNNWIQINAI